MGSRKEMEQKKKKCIGEIIVEDFQKWLKNANITNIRCTENPGLQKTTNACTGSTPTPHTPIFIRIKLL